MVIDVRATQVGMMTRTYCATVRAVCYFNLVFGIRIPRLSHTSEDTSTTTTRNKQQKQLVC